MGGEERESESVRVEQPKKERPKSTTTPNTKTSQASNVYIGMRRVSSTNVVKVKSDLWIAPGHLR